MCLAPTSISSFDDLLIKRDHETLKFEVYRMKTHTYTYITNNSNHCWQHKMAAWDSSVYRLASIPMSITDYKKKKN